MESATVHWATACAGGLLFLESTAFDTPKFKRIGLLAGIKDKAHHASFLGAPRLYLDFVNLFLLLLRFSAGAGRAACPAGASIDIRTYHHVIDNGDQTMNRNGTSDSAMMYLNTYLIRLDLRLR